MAPFPFYVRVHIYVCDNKRKLLLEIFMGRHVYGGRGKYS